MLVLTRKIGEGIQITGGIEIRVLRVLPGGVRLGIKAPPHVNIAREELTLSFAGVSVDELDNVALDLELH